MFYSFLESTEPTSQFECFLKADNIPKQYSASSLTNPHSLSHHKDMQFIHRPQQGMTHELPPSVPLP